MKISGEDIQKIAYVILGIGILSGVILGAVYQVDVPISKWSDLTRAQFNWVLMIGTWIGAFFTSLLIYIGGAVMDGLERINYAVQQINARELERENGAENYNE